MASTKGINATLLSAFNAMKAAAAREGIRIGIGSGYRTVEEQIALRRQNGCPDIWSSPASSCRIPTAIPGKSMHNHGFAIDFTGDDRADRWVAQNAGKFGLHLPVKGENWHLELIDHDKVAAGSTAVGMGLANMIDQQNPEDELANRVHSILRIVGMGQTDTTLPEDMIGLSGTDLDTGAAPMPGQDTIDIPMADIGSTEVTQGAPGPQSKSSMGKFHSTVQGAYQNFAKTKLKDFGWSENEISSLSPLWQHESNWNPNAQNPTSTAFGIAQFLNGTWGGTGIAKTKDPYRQILAGLTYIKGRYGSPSKAWEFWQKNHWY